MAPASEAFFIGVANRPHPRETVSGDAWFIDLQPEGLRVAVVDGAGHGELARNAADAAIAVLKLEGDRPLAEQVRACHAAMRGTRGGVLSLATIAAGGMRAEFAGVGNVETLVANPGGETHVLAQRGILGYTMPTVRPVSIDLEPGWLLILTTDGVQTRFSMRDPDLIRLALDGPQPLADGILERYNRHDDDSTVLVIVPNPTWTPPGA